MANVSHCPEFLLLEKLAREGLSEPQQTTLLEHLEGCPTCAQWVAALPPSDTLVDLIRQADTLTQTLGAADVQPLIEKLRQLWPGADAARNIPTQNLEATPVAATIKCPGCGKTLRFKGTPRGRALKCPNCQQKIQLPTQGGKATTPPTLQRPLPQGEAARYTAAKAVYQPTVTLPPSARATAYGFLAPAQESDEIGRLGQYRVLEVLGSGGMGVVFKAEDSKLKRLVALKAMLPSAGLDANSKERFLAEARAAASVKHDNVVTIHQVDEDQAIPFIAMEFLQGESLETRLQRESKLPRKEILRIAREIAEGLAAAHELGLVHRDIKPGNIWLEQPRGRVKILDFGLARPADQNSRLTTAGAIVGTPAFMCPEQAGGRVPDARGDLFSLGCIMYLLCAGDFPFQGKDAISTLVAVASHTPKPVQDLDPSLPPIWPL